jgi:hypothetical protein
VPPPDAQDFAARAVLWLLDEAPPEFRSHTVFRDYPAALAFAVGHYVAGALAASREAYADCRRTLAGTLAPPEVEAVLRALEFEGVRLVRVQREVGLVAEALAGRRWVERL